MGGRKKSKLKRAFSAILRVRAWKLIILAVLFGFLAATALRLDHIKMANLRQDVLVADEEGDQQKIIDSLNKLRDYTSHHVIFNLVEENGFQRITYGTGPFYLEHEYLRQAEKILAEAREKINENSSNPNGNIYQKVAEYCDALSLEYGWGFNSSYVACWEEELAKYPSSGEISIADDAKIPSTELFRYDFASPIWYPCLSGWLMAATVILFAWATIRILIWIALQIALKIMDGKN